jgi:hypothetical protein
VPRLTLPGMRLDVVARCDAFTSASSFVVSSRGGRPV